MPALEVGQRSLSLRHETVFVPEAFRACAADIGNSAVFACFALRNAAVNERAIDPRWRAAVYDLAREINESDMPHLERNWEEEQAEYQRLQLRVQAAAGLKEALREDPRSWVNLQKPGDGEDDAGFGGSEARPIVTRNDSATISAANVYKIGESAWPQTHTQRLPSLAMDSQQPSSPEGDTLFRAMENMLRTYSQRPASGETSSDTEVGAQDSTVRRSDAIAAAHQLAGFIAASTDPRVTPDPGGAAAFLMILVEYIDPQTADLDGGSRAALEAFVDGLRRLEPDGVWADNRRFGRL